MRLANVVHGHFNLAHGERAAVFMPNRIEYLEIVCGLSSAGVAACTIGPAASPAEIRFICEDSSSRVLFVAPALEEAARAAVGDIVPHIVALDERYEALLANARSDSLPVDTDWEDIFSIPYTSGSTGRPKGVMLSHRCRVLSSYAMASEHGCYGPDDRAVATTPMFHGSGFLMTLAPVFFGGFVELLPAFNIEAADAQGRGGLGNQRLHGADPFQLAVRDGRRPPRLQPQLAEVRHCRHRAVVPGHEGADRGVHGRRASCSNDTDRPRLRS